MVGVALRLQFVEEQEARTGVDEGLGRLARAEAEADAAAAEIAFLPESNAKLWMLELCAYAVRRTA